MFESSHPFLFFDYFRVPYVRARSNELNWGWVRRKGHDRRLLWPLSEPEARPELLLPALDGGRPAEIGRRENGDVYLPFDPGAVMASCWSERYLAPIRDARRGRAKTLAMRTYYRARPLLPRPVQIAMRRAFSTVQVRTKFPRWPLEPGLHNLYDLLFDELSALAEEPVPWLAPWPAGRSWALVLTHDVEKANGYESIDILARVEEKVGFRSAWNLVPRRYDVDEGRVEELARRGFEVGVHGLYHDGRDLESEERLAERLPEMRAYAERWKAVGFRSPATHRDWHLMSSLGFDYDSSYPDTDPFEPQAGGCCSLLPFMNGDLVELPITLPQDHTLFVILRHTDERVWVEKAQEVRKRGGMALLVTHPDYMLDEHYVDLYRRFLERFSSDDEAWKPLPREVSAWWRRRAASSLERAGRQWRVVGPAAGEAAVRMAAPTSGASA